MKEYESLFRQYKGQAPASIFAHFYPVRNGTDTDFDGPFKALAQATIDGYDSWTFQQERFQKKHSYSVVPKLRNYLNYTFVRLVALENQSPGDHFLTSKDDEWTCFNTGLQNPYGADIYATFQRFRPKKDFGRAAETCPDWVFKGICTPTESRFRDLFGIKSPRLAWYSKDSRDFVFDTSYTLDKEAFDHLLERAKERAGLPNVSDEVIRNYLRGAIENLVPKIARNYKVAIPVYYVEEKRMQLLLPFVSASNSNDVSCFLVERNDAHKCYSIKTIFDLDQAYFSARLLTRPDRDWLNP